MHLKYILVLIFSTLALTVNAKDTDCLILVEKPEAIELAKQYIIEHQLEGKVLLPEERVNGNNCEWTVWFKKNNWQLVKPSRKAIIVNMTSGKAILMPSK